MASHAFWISWPFSTLSTEYFIEISAYTLSRAFLSPLPSIMYLLHGRKAMSIWNSSSFTNTLDDFELGSYTTTILYAVEWWSWSNILIQVFIHLTWHYWERNVKLLNFKLFTGRITNKRKEHNLRCSQNLLFSVLLKIAIPPWQRLDIPRFSM